MNDQMEMKAELRTVDRGEGRETALISLRVGKGRMHVMYLSNEEGWAMAALSSDPAEAMRSYRRATEGELSPLHLENFCEDEQKRTEIFQ